MSIRVAIFEDSDAVRDAISLLVKGTRKLELAGAFPDCNNLMDDIRDSSPDLVLMDIGMPGLNGVQAVKLIKKNFPQMIVVMQTVFENDDTIFEAICAGASGYLLKDEPPSRLMESIVEAYEGGSPMSSVIARKTLLLFQKFLAPLADAGGTNYRLTVREKEILQWMVSGYSYKMIAEACKISFDTVRTHIRNIYEKLHVASMSEAVAKVLKERLV
ncbi:MAG: response regulator [Chitinophagales bacterium]